MAEWLTQRHARGIVPRSQRVCQSYTLIRTTVATIFKNEIGTIDLVHRAMIFPSTFWNTNVVAHWKYQISNIQKYLKLFLSSFTAKIIQRRGLFFLAKKKKNLKHLACCVCTIFWTKFEATRTVFYVLHWSLFVPLIRKLYNYSVANKKKRKRNTWKLRGRVKQGFLSAVSIQSKNTENLYTKCSSKNYYFT